MELFEMKGVMHSKNDTFICTSQLCFWLLKLSNKMVVVS